ncbi:MAG: DUF1501 domain-containing protein [Bacteroidia bacterium]
MNRRHFIKHSAFASAGAMMIPSFLKPFEALGADTLAQKILVIIQLSGGNDGLNTVIPFENDLYHNKRPSLGYGKEEVVKLNEQLGLNPSMQSLKEIFDNGWMSIINNVGYPNPDRSHFRSMDIWQTASGSDEFLSTGWIGRYLDSQCSGCQNPYQAIEVDDTLSLAMKGATKKGLAVKDAKRLFNETREPFFKNIVSNYKPEMLSEDHLGYLYKTMIETYSSADYVYNNVRTYNNNFIYPQSQFADQLKTISKFIQSGLSTRVYYVSHGSFDTHVGQKNQQERLLKQYADGVAAFLKDLKQGGKLDDVLVLTFSEFGRRVEQNASNGTDHGTANNVFVYGGGLKQKGILNDLPNLADLDEGDLKYTIDFRNVYATVLDNWLQINNQQVLNKNFKKMDFV